MMAPSSDADANMLSFDQRKKSEVDTFFNNYTYMYL